MNIRISLFFAGALFLGWMAAIATTASGEEAKYTTPAVEGFGKVVQLADAAQQPRAGSRMVVDLTKGGADDELNSSLEKVARYVNIYAGAGKKPATVKIAVVLHGDATLLALQNAAYASRFKTSENPNLALMQKLRASGVEFFVCGQSLIGKGAAVSEVDDSVQVAVSALTALVNLQTDGYAYIPLLK
ncbi:MAG: DsrE family protein [bacterium]|nr:DsrE family protein [bacterium]